MAKKVWHKTIIVTQEQNVIIYPTDEYDGIIVETKELDDKTGSPQMYLSENEMEMLILKMREMMDFTENK
jgi:hypothetical protein